MSRTGLLGHSAPSAADSGTAAARQKKTTRRAAATQSSLIFFSRTTRAQRASSSLNIFPNSALEVGAGTAPDCNSVSRTSGASSTATTASCNFATMAAGGFSGANNPYQLWPTVSGEPCSARVVATGYRGLRMQGVALVGG